MKIVDGAIAELGPASELVSRDPVSGESHQTGASYAFIRIARAGKREMRLDEVIIGARLADCVKPAATGRFAFYQSGRFNVLCGFADGQRTEIALAADDPLAIETEVQRTLGKRKIFIGVALIPTIIGLFFAPDWIRAGRAILKAHPRPRRPTEAKIRRRLAR